MSRRMNASKTRPVLFLDFDDVLCLNKPVGGYDVMLALSQVEKGTAKVQDFEAIWAQLFAPEARALLQKIHDEFEPAYVLSTSWRMFMNKHALVAVLMNTGLEFVAAKLHPDWQTPQFNSPQLRAREIGSWVGQNPDQGNNWVVLDDECSGTGYGEDYPIQGNRPFIVLCRQACGLAAPEYEKLRAAFGLRLSMTGLRLGGHHDNG